MGNQNFKRSYPKRLYNAIHTGDKLAFRDLMLSYGIMDYKTNFNITKKVFFDRGIPELIGYSELISEPITQSIKDACEFRYSYTERCIVIQCDFMLSLFNNRDYSVVN